MTNGPVTTTQYRIGFGLLLLVCFALNLGGWPLFDVDEGAFSAATMHMGQTGDLITTYLYGEPRFDKPILIYYLQLISTQIFGSNEFAYRLPSAVAGILWVLALYQFCLSVGSKKTASYVAVLMMTSLGVWSIARFATVDSVLNLLLCLAFIDIYRYYERPTKSLLLRVFVWLGLGLLAKGPIAVAVPLAGAAVLFIATGQRIRLLKAIFNPFGWAIMIMIAAPWYWLAYLEQGQAFIEGFFITHNVERFAATMEGHGGYLWYYLPIVFIVFLPNSGLLIPLLTRTRFQLLDPLSIYCWGTFAFVFCFFSLSSTQLPHYLLYGLSPLAILIARHYEQGSPPHLLLHLTPSLAFSLIIANFPTIAKTVEQKTTDIHLSAMISPLSDMDMGWFYLLAWLFVGLHLLLFVVKTSLMQRMIALGVCQALTLTLAFIPVVGELKQGPVKRAAMEAKSREETVVMWNANAPSFATYYGQSVSRRLPLSNELLFTRVDYLAPMSQDEVVFEEGGWVLILKK